MITAKMVSHPSMLGKSTLLTYITKLHDLFTLNKYLWGLIIIHNSHHFLLHKSGAY